MAEIRVVFYEVFDDNKESEDLIDFFSATVPTYKEGDELSFIEAKTDNATFLQGFAKSDREATHKIVRANHPVIVWTKDTSTDKKIVTSEIFIYYLKKLEHKPGIPVSTLAGWLP